MELKYPKGNRITKRILDYAGVTVEHLEHVMTQIPSMIIESVKRLQYMPFDINDDGAFIAYTGGPSSRLVQFLVDKARNSLPVRPNDSSFLDRRDTGGESADQIPCIYITKDPGYGIILIPSALFTPVVKHPVIILPSYLMHSEETKCTVRIDGTRRSKTNSKISRIKVHGKYVDLKDMPLYATNGEDGLDVVYPIFDWTDLQVVAACVLYDIPFQT